MPDRTAGFPDVAHRRRPGPRRRASPTCRGHRRRGPETVYESTTAAPGPGSFTTGSAATSTTVHHQAHTGAERLYATLRSERRLSGPHAPQRPPPRTRRRRFLDAGPHRRRPGRRPPETARPQDAERARHAADTADVEPETVSESTTAARGRARSPPEAPPRPPRTATAATRRAPGRLQPSDPNVVLRRRQGPQRPQRPPPRTEPGPSSIPHRTASFPDDVEPETPRPQDAERARHAADTAAANRKPFPSPPPPHRAARATLRAWMPPFPS